MPQTPQPTRQELQNLINQIVTGGNYLASEMRPLLSNLLEGIYSPFFSAATNPGSANNQTQTYKAGSLGKNTSNGRFFACTAADGVTASWEQITLDKQYQSISALASQTYTISNNVSIASISGSQNGVTINLPVAANCYNGKVLKIYFSSPAQTSGSGVTFVVPEVAPITILAANVYTAHATIEFTFVGSAWVLTEYNPFITDSGYQSIQISEGGTATMVKDTALLAIVKSFVPASYTAYNVLLPPDPYAGKTVKITTNNNITSITTLTVKRSDGVTISSGAINANEAVEFFYTGAFWIQVAPTIMW